MRGRPTRPTEQKKHSVGATAGSPLFLLLQGKVGYRVAPSSAPVCALGHLPPEGKALGVGASLSDYNTHPSQPAQLVGGPLRAVGYGPPARQKKTEDLPRVLPTRAGSPEGRNPPLWPSFSPFLGRNGDPAGQAGPPGRCAPRLRNSPDHPKGTQYRPPPPRRGLFLPKSLDKGSLIG